MWDTLILKFLSGELRNGENVRSVEHLIGSEAGRGEGGARKISNSVDYVAPVAINSGTLSVKNPVFPVFLVSRRRIVEAERKGGSSGRFRHYEHFNDVYVTRFEAIPRFKFSSSR